MSHSPADGLSAPVTTYNAWDADAMRGCDCDAGFFGHDCSLVRCPTGDDPLTDAGRAPVAEQRVTCQGDAGSATLSFRGATTPPIPWDAGSAAVRAALLALPTLTGQAGDEAFGDARGLLPAPMNAQTTGRAVAVALLDAKATWCGTSGNTAVITFNQDFGPDVPLVVPDATNLRLEASFLLKPGISVTLSARSGKENAVCSNRGLCDALTGRCGCDQENYGSSDGFGHRGSRGDCGVAVNIPIVDCPGDVPCNGHGACSSGGDAPDYTCLCQEGWTGADCSEMACPEGRTWYGEPTGADAAHVAREECSGAGACDRALGTCLCAAGYVGAACDHMACPRGGRSEVAPYCSGHGRCLSMQHLAAEAGFTYRSDPDDPYTWDADAIGGCHCDSGYHGFDCSLRTCVTGDDPLTSTLVEAKTCSGRGICDESSGLCRCFDQFGSSDGQGGKGHIEDCGYVLPIIPGVI